jgi:hydroxyacid-oxoacid transhydrogenase
VVLNAPSVFRFTAATCPERHLAGARRLGAEAGGATPGEAGHVLAEQLVRMMRETGLPNGLAGVGYGEADVDALTRGTLAQARLLANAPCAVDAPRLAELFHGALAYW